MTGLIPGAMIRIDGIRQTVQTCFWRGRRKNIPCMGAEVVGGRPCLYHSDNGQKDGDNPPASLPWHAGCFEAAMGAACPAGAVGSAELGLGRALLTELAEEGLAQ